MTRRLFLNAGLAAAPSLASLASQPVTGRKLILHADDGGVSHSTNMAIIAMFESGSISSASVMMPTAWAAEFANWARNNTKMDIGLHLTLTSEWKGLRWPTVAPVDKAPGLLDPHGYMWADVRSAATHATPKEIDIEMRAQIEKARKLGIRFTHLDTHMGTVYARPDFFEVYWKLGADYGVPVMLMKPNSMSGDQGTEEIRRYILSQEPRFQKEGRFRLDSLMPDPVRGTKTIDERRKGYLDALERLPAGVHQLIVHPAKLDEELRAMTGSAVARDMDYRIFSEPSMKQWFAEKKIELVGYQDVAGKG